MPTEDDIQLAEEVESALRALGIADVRTRKDPRLKPHVMALRGSLDTRRVYDDGILLSECERRD